MVQLASNLRIWNYALLPEMGLQARDAHSGHLGTLCFATETIA